MCPVVEGLVTLRVVGGVYHGAQAVLELTGRMWECLVGTEEYFQQQDQCVQRCSYLREQVAFWELW